MLPRGGMKLVTLFPPRARNEQRKPFQFTCLQVRSLFRVWTLDMCGVCCRGASSVEES